MLVDPVSHTSYFEFKINDELTNLFKLAHEEKWDDVFSKTEKDPHILNSVMQTGPDAGKTILWIASLKQTQEAYYFLHKALNLEIPFHMNVSPLAGPDQGKTVFWNLAFEVFLNNRGYTILNECISKFNCDVNSSPIVGTLKGVTVYVLLLSQPSHARFTTFYKPKVSKSTFLEKNNLSPNSLPNALISIIHHIEIHPKDFDIKINDLNNKYLLHDTYSKEEILNHCYQNVINLIEEIPSSHLNTFSCRTKTIELGEETDLYSRPLDVVLSLPPSPNRNTLLLCLIVAGAQSDTTKKELKEEYEGILRRLNSSYQRVLTTIHSLFAQKILLPKELIQGIAYDSILTEFKDVPQGLINRFFSGLNFNLKPPIKEGLEL